MSVCILNYFRLWGGEISVLDIHSSKSKSILPYATWRHLQLQHPVLLRTMTIYCKKDTMQKAVKPFRTWRDAGQDNGQNPNPDFQCHHNSISIQWRQSGKGKGKGPFLPNPAYILAQRCTNCGAKLPLFRRKISNFAKKIRLWQKIHWKSSSWERHNLQSKAWKP